MQLDTPSPSMNPNTGFQVSTGELSPELKYELSKMHEQFKISVETEHENKLAKEIRDVYCQLSKIKRTQAIILAQTNGLLAAAALSLPICSRLNGFGQAMTLQQCEPRRILLSAKETKCGFQPLFTYSENNCTIGTDGWSIHPYSDCFWKTPLININGYPHAWEHNDTNGDWVKQDATIHTPNLDLIAEFEELHLNNFDYTLKRHPAHNILEMEQLNILNELVGKLQEGEPKSLSDIIVTEEQDNKIGNMFSWFDTLKIISIATIGFILFLICLRAWIACNPFPKLIAHLKTKYKRGEIEQATDIEHALRTEENPNNLPAKDKFATSLGIAPIQKASAPEKENIYSLDEPNRTCTGNHTICSYVVGHGMVWEDLCKCTINPNH
ncbi:hypothetical protein GHT06_021661 [Daphnia sinensis]|uniref:Uncharacterized protein n=1 Tax=Daphnia sinensis TaxID=1820382 RepID=A0AAD5PSP3_9CRUS|nr:hypothetical protein GHT06_021661 [Daphnia sinensis]